MNKIPREVYTIGAGLVAAYFVYGFLKGEAGKTAAKLNPLNNDNIVANAADATISTVTGNRYLSVGDFFFNLFNPNAPGENGSI